MGWIKRLYQKLPWVDGMIHPKTPLQEPQDDSKDGSGADDIYGMAVLPQELLRSALEVPKNRRERYRLMDNIDEDIMASVLDLYGEEATQYLEETPGDIQAVQVRVTSESDLIGETCNDLLKFLGLSHDMLPLARSVGKMGDVFYKVLYAPYIGIQYGDMIKEPEDITRIEDMFGKIRGYKQKGINNFRLGQSNISYPWDFIHFRNRLRLKFTPYGTPIVYNGTRAYRQLVMAEDSALLYRLLRHPDRLLHLIDVGRMGYIEAKKAMRDYERKYKRRIYQNRGIGRYDHRNIPLTPTDDIFLPTTEKSNTRIEKLPGSANAGDVHDVDMYVNKFFSNVRVPKAYLGFEQDVNARATLTNQSARFARSVKKLQDVLKLGIREICELHLQLLAKNETDETYDWTLKGKHFKVEMGVVSYLTELDWIDLLNMRISAAQAVLGLAESPNVDLNKLTAYAFRAILKFTDSQVTDMVLKKPRPETIPVKAGLGVEDVDDLLRKLLMNPTLDENELGILKHVLEHPVIKDIVYYRLQSQISDSDGSDTSFSLPDKGKYD